MTEVEELRSELNALKSPSSGQTSFHRLGFRIRTSEVSIRSRFSSDSPVLSIAAIGAIAVRLLLGFRPYDDAFIAYRYAANLVDHGHLVYNLGESVFGTTSLLYALLLAGLHFLGLEILHAAWLLSLLADIGCVLALCQLALSAGHSRVFALTAAAAYLLHPVIAFNSIGGLETSLFCLLLLRWLLFLHRRQAGWATALALGLIWIRPEGLLLWPLTAFWWWREGRPRLAVPPMVLGFSLLGLYLLTTFALFGTPIPNTVLAKAAASIPDVSGGLIIGLSYLTSIAGLLSVWTWHISPHWILLIGLPGLFSGVRLRLAPVERMSALTGMAFLGAFALTGRLSTTLYVWYYVPFLTLLLLPLMASLEMLLHQLKTEPRHGWGLEIVLVLLAIGSGLLLLLPINKLLIGPLHVLELNGLLRNPVQHLPQLEQLLVVNTRRLLLMTLITLSLFWSWRKAGQEQPLAWRGRPVPQILAVFGLLFSFLALQSNRTHLTQKYARRESSYLVLGRWAQQALGTDAMVAAREIGALGWGGRRLRIFDEVGLVTPAAMGKHRQEWIARVRPAMLVDASRDINVRGPVPQLAGYLTISAGQNRMYLRRDIASRLEEGLFAWPDAAVDPPLEQPE